MTALVIGVNYQTDEHAVKFVRSLEKYSAGDVTAILVDNTERSDPSEFFRRIGEANANIRCLQAAHNLGYFGGANFGLGQYLVSSPLPDWVIVCNVDIEFRDSQFFSTLRELEGSESLGVVAPRIWSARSKRDLNAKISQRPTNRRMILYKVIFGNYYLQLAYEILSVLKEVVTVGIREGFALFRRHPEVDKQTKQAFSIYAPHGSCMIFSRRYFKAGGNFEYSVFLFGEEIFVAETAMRLGLSVNHCPWLWVHDTEHASTGIIRSRKIAGYMKDATNYLVEHYFA
jgi:GT2 family glycosyltransferase